MVQETRMTDRHIWVRLWSASAVSFVE